MVRLIGVTTTALVLTLGAGTAEATPDGDKPDKPGHSKQAENGRAGNPPGQSNSDTSSPQPPSNADFSGHGANQHGAYDSTRDGSPSGNGNGDGNATGKPCAGCVGKADNKNPPGQFPDGTDGNAGYECDRNSGIGKTNPAHTGCKADEPPPPPPPNGKNGDKDGNGKKDGKKPTVVLVPVAQPVPAEQSKEEALATTGSDVWPPLGIGFALLLAGSALVAASRATRAVPTRLDEVFGSSQPR